MAILRNIAITLFKGLDHKILAKTTRHLRNHPGKILEMIGFSLRRRLCRGPAPRATSSENNRGFPDLVMDGSDPLQRPNNAVYLAQYIF